jgi:Tfp pilus assembly protein PilF
MMRIGDRNTTGRVARALCGFGLAAAVALAGCASDGNNTPKRETSEERRARSHYGLGIDHMRQGRVALALRELQAAKRLNPNDKWISLSLSEAYRLKGRSEEALELMLEAVELDPKFHAAHLNLSAHYVHLERYEDAVREATILIDDPTFPAPWKALANRGWAQYKLGRLSEARESLTMALEYNESYVPAMLSLAVIDAEQGYHLEALNHLESVIETKPSPIAAAEANFRIAEVYVSLGNREKAVHHLIAATEQKPSGKWGKRSEDYLRRLR